MPGDVFVEKGKVLLPVAVVCAIATAAWVVRGSISDLNLNTQMQTREIERLNLRVEELAVELSIAASDRWRRSDMAAWAYAFEILNAEAGLRVPPVSDEP